MLFILATTEEQKVPATIISRCRKLYFEKIRVGEIAGALRAVCEKHAKAFEPDALTLIAKASDGCMRDALSILEGFFDAGITVSSVTETLGNCKEDVVFDILDAVQKGDAASALNALRASLSRGASLQSVIKAIMEAVTDSIFLLHGASLDTVINTAAYKERLVGFSKTVDPERCIELTNRLSEVYSGVTKSADAAFIVESTLIGMVRYESQLADLQTRLKAVESGAVVVQKPETEQTVTETACESPVESVEQETEEPSFIDCSMQMEEEFIPELYDGAFSEERSEDAGETIVAEQCVATEEKPEVAPPLMEAAVPFDEDVSDVLSHLPEGTVVSEAQEMLFTESDAVPAEELPLVETTQEPKQDERKSALGKIMSSNLAETMIDGLGDLPFFNELLGVL